MYSYIHIRAYEYLYVVGRISLSHIHPSSFSGPTDRPTDQRSSTLVSACERARARVKQRLAAAAACVLSPAVSERASERGYCSSVRVAPPTEGGARDSITSGYTYTRIVFAIECTSVANIVGLVYVHYRFLNRVSSGDWSVLPAGFIQCASV